MQSQKLQALRMQNLDVEQWFFGSGGSNAGSSSSVVGSVVSSCSSSLSSSTLIGDYIGNESCLDLTNDDGIFVSSSRVNESDQRFNLLDRRRGRRWATKKEKKEFPPPIPLLARTENLPCHMPWVLQRYYTSDGRLILKEERVKHHGYIRAHRSNGRLTLQLVSLDDEYYGTHYFSEDGENDDQIEHCSDENELEKGKEKEENNGLKVYGNGEEKEKEENELEKCCSEEPKEEEKNELENGEGEREMEKFCSEEFKETQVNDNGGGVDGNGIMKKQDQARVASSATNGNGGNVIANFKCFDYSRMSIKRPGSTCIFEIPAPAMSPKGNTYLDLIHV